jgi:hypothetical protein
MANRPQQLPAPRTWTRTDFAALHEKSRVRIEHSDLPADLQAAAGELVAVLWSKSTTSAQVRIQELEQAQAAGEATRIALEGEIARLQEENAARDRALVQAKADFAQELEKLRDSAGLADERLHAAEKRALLRGRQ